MLDDFRLVCDCEWGLSSCLSNDPWREEELSPGNDSGGGTLAEVSLNFHGLA